MKKLLTIGLFFFVATILWATKLPDSSNNISSMWQVKKDKGLVLNLVVENSRKLLRVSFNGNEGTDGDLNIYNAAHEKKAEFSFELIPFPNYATVDVTDLAKGTYTVELSTKKAIHTASLSIQ